jgi:hypothetical protein
MTACTAILALIPLAIGGNQPGHEIEYHGHRDSWRLNDLDVSESFFCHPFILGLEKAQIEILPA